MSECPALSGIQSNTLAKELIKKAITEIDTSALSPTQQKTYNRIAKNFQKKEPKPVEPKPVEKTERTELEELPKLAAQLEKAIGDTETPPEEQMSKEELEQLDAGLRKEEASLRQPATLTPIQLSAEKQEISDTYEEALQDLTTFKKELGDSPNYPTGNPSRTSTETFLFLPIDTVRAWISKAVRNKWFPQALWNYVSKSLGLQKPVTHYEYAYLTQVCPR